ncbi:MAG: hypothetical protein HEQ39_09600 [Rhizobacter sp.]
MAAPIDFAGLAAALLLRVDSLLPVWLPGGRFDGNEYKCADLSGGKGDSLSVNIKTGAWADFANDGDRGGDLTSLRAAIRGINNAQAARELMADLGWEREAVQTPAPAPAQQRPPEPQQGAASKKRSESDWHPIVPVPANTPEPTFNHWHRGQPSHTWAYRFEGELFGYVCRYDTSDGGKEILPHTWCEDASDGRGTRRWHFKQWDDPRPLYVPATTLGGDSALPVVVFEGEKCTAAVHKLLGCTEFYCVSWPGGGKAWPKAAWRLIAGRRVVLWPDADAKRQRLSKDEREAGVDPASKPLLPLERQPGWETMVGIGGHLMVEHGCSVFMCRIHDLEGLPDGWDVADAISQGWDAEMVRNFILTASPLKPPDAAAGNAVAEQGAARASAGAGNKGIPQEPSWWREVVTTGSNRAPAKVRENILLAMDGKTMPDGSYCPGIPGLRGLVVFNEFSNAVVKTRAPPWGGAAGAWEEEDELEMGRWLNSEHGLPPMNVQTLSEAVLMIAKRHRHHPAREYFLKLQGTWDGERRLGGWLERAVRQQPLPDGDPLKEYLKRVGAWVLMGICARVLPTQMKGAEVVRGPGTKFDYMMILEGGQGVGKSTLARILGLDWFADTGLNLDNKDSFQNLQGVLVYEWSEMDSLNRSDVAKVKQFISSQKDRFRAPFDRRPKDYPRQVVFVGTTNESHYLTDGSGNRRFWPVEVTRRVDLAYVKENLEQLYAEALEYLARGYRFHPTPDEQNELFNPQQAERAVEGGIESAIRRFLYDEDQKTGINGINGSLISEVTLGDLLLGFGISVDKQTTPLMKQASAALGRLGWKRWRGAKREDESRPWVYRRPGASDSVGDAPDRSDDSAPW